MDRMRFTNVSEVLWQVHDRWGGGAQAATAEHDLNLPGYCDAPTANP